MRVFKRLPIQSSFRLGISAMMVGLALSNTNAQNHEENYHCGTPESTIGNALGKSAADFPSRRKWPASLKVLMVRVAFSDAPYTIDTTVIKKAHADINGGYGSMSRNAFQWDFKIHPIILQAPGTAASYGSNFNSLQTWCTTQIKNAGLVWNTDYNVANYSFPNINVGWAGLSNLRDWNFINGSYGAGVTGHELGHTLGLMHSHAIEAGTDIFGTPGTTSQTDEYGNPYDIMGRGGVNGHFNVLYKWRISWIDSNELFEVKNSGVYRVYASDNALHKNRIIGLRIPTGNPAYAYWIEYRTASTFSRVGAAVEFQGFNGTNNYDNWILDTTPQSRTSSDATDAVLIAGKTLTDKYAGPNGALTITTVAVNTGVWDQNGWVELNINIPGTTPILAFTSKGLRLHSKEHNAPAYNLIGQTLQRLSRGQAAVQKRPEGQFVLNTH